MCLAYHDRSSFQPRGDRWGCRGGGLRPFRSQPIGLSKPRPLPRDVVHIFDRALSVRQGATWRRGVRDVHKGELAFCSDHHGRQEIHQPITHLEIRVLEDFQQRHRRKHRYQTACS